MRTISWRLIFNEFKKTYPSMSRNVSNWYPTGHLEITVKLNDGTKIIFDYTTKKSQVIPCEQEILERRKVMDEYDWREEFASRLCDMLYEVGMTQKELAEKAEIDERTIRMYKHGDRTPNAYIVYKLANALGCSPSELIDFD
jgi:ribosome-binding protein aMBF1 (putative translation factor)